MLGPWLVFLGVIALTLTFLAIMRRWLNSTERDERQG